METANSVVEDQEEDAKVSVYYWEEMSSSSPSNTSSSSKIYFTKVHKVAYMAQEEEEDEDSDICSDRTKESAFGSFDSSKNHMFFGVTQRAEAGSRFRGGVEKFGYMPFCQNEELLQKRRLHKFPMMRGLKPIWNDKHDDYHFELIDDDDEASEFSAASADDSTMGSAASKSGSGSSFLPVQPKGAWGWICGTKVPDVAEHERREVWRQTRQQERERLKKLQFSAGKGIIG